MLQLSVVSSRPTSFFTLPAIYQPIVQGGAVVNYHCYPPLVTVGGDKTQNSYPLEWGALVQGREAKGQLRDKEVIHFSLAGELKVEQPGYVDADVPQHTGTISVEENEDAHWTLPFGAVSTINSYGRPQFTNGAVVVHGTIVWLSPDTFAYAMVREIPAMYETWPGGDLLLVPGHCIASLYVYRYSNGTLGERFVTNGDLASPLGDQLIYQGEYYSLDAPGIASYLVARDPIVATNYLSPTDFRYTDATIDLTALIQYVRIKLEGLSVGSLISVTNYISDDEHVWGELAVECRDQLKLVDKNLLFLIYDMRDVGSMFRNLKLLSGAPLWRLAIQRHLWQSGLFGRASRTKLSPDNFDDLVRMIPRTSSALMAKALAGMFLFKSYGVDTCVSDVRSGAKGIVKFLQFPKHQRLHARRESSVTIDGRTIRHRRVLTVETDRYPTWFTGRVQEAIGDAKNWGVFPELANLWDILKYSFVVDRIVNFGAVWRDVDSYLNVKNYFPVRLVMQSDKWSYPLVTAQIFPDYGITGEVVVQHYHRWVAEEIPLPEVTSVKLGSGLGNDFSGQISALVVQRLR